MQNHGGQSCEAARSCTITASPRGWLSFHPWSRNEETHGEVPLPGVEMQLHLTLMGKKHLLEEVIESWGGLLLQQS